MVALRGSVFPRNSEVARMSACELEIRFPARVWFSRGMGACADVVLGVGELSGFEIGEYSAFGGTRYKGVC